MGLSDGVPIGHQREVAPPSKARQVSGAAVVGATRPETMPIKLATAKVFRLVHIASLSLFGDDFAILPLTRLLKRTGRDDSSEVLRT